MYPLTYCPRRSIVSLASGRNHIGRGTVDECDVILWSVHDRFILSASIGITVPSTRVIMYEESPGDEEGTPVTVPRMDTLDVEDL